jgi:hypothetical protein
MSEVTHRKAAEKQIIADISLIANDGGKNAAVYQEMFDRLTDEEFHQFMVSIDSPDGFLPIYEPVMSGAKIDPVRNIAIGRSWGHEFYQHIQVPAIGSVPAYTTPIPYLVTWSPVRRQAQLLAKKISVPSHNRSVDELTGQPTGDSKGSKVSNVEAGVLSARGEDAAIEELFKYRGGDEAGFRAMNMQAERSGRVSLQSIAPFAGGVKSTHTVYTYLTGMHLQNTLKQSARDNDLGKAT